MDGGEQAEGMKLPKAYPSGASRSLPDQIAAGAVVPRRKRKRKQCDPSQHDFKEVYYGSECVRCGLLYPHGTAPWDEELEP